MSQQLTPVNGGIVPQVVTTTAPTRINVLSPQYIDIFNLQSRPTEWIPGGRPIYHRLPAASETYQINFFNVVTESNLTRNNKVRTNIEEVGYVYVPWGDSIEGPTSCQVVSSDSKQTLLIKAGVIIWKYGRTEVIPTIVDLKVLDVLSGQYEVAYQLIYDDSSTANLYSVEDFSLTGLPLIITSNTDAVIGWRYPAVNAFLNTETSRWSTQDTYFASYAQPAGPSYLQWESELSHAYSKIVLRCPTGTAYTGTATLSYVTRGIPSEVTTTSIQSDANGQFFEITLDSPVLQNGWNVTFSSTEVSIQSITVSGVLSLITPQSGPSPRAVLVMYPVNARPDTVTNSQGEEIPAVYVTLAYVDVTKDQKIEKIRDTREIIHRDYVPVSDWLTEPFDTNLINIYEQVSKYAQLWMAPPTSLFQEYEDLEKDQILVET